MLAVRWQERPPEFLIFARIAFLYDPVQDMEDYLFAHNFRKLPRLALVISCNS